MKRLTILFAVALLAGCATMGVSPDDPELQQASENANNAIEKAEEVGAKDANADEFQSLQDQFSTLEQSRQDQPSADLLKQYHQLERSAYQLAVQTLQDRFKKLDSRVSDLQKQLDERVSGLEKEKKELQNQLEEASKKAKKL
ncbi:MAG: hypothetical protein ABEK50_05765, partial [bacterium]